MPLWLAVPGLAPPPSQLALLQKPDLMTHPGAEPQQAGGGHTDAWSSQWGQGEGQCVLGSLVGIRSSYQSVAPQAGSANWREELGPSPC